MEEIERIINGEDRNSVETNNFELKPFLMSMVHNKILIRSSNKDDLVIFVTMFYQNR